MSIKLTQLLQLLLDELRKCVLAECSHFLLDLAMHQLHGVCSLQVTGGAVDLVPPPHDRVEDVCYAEEVCLILLKDSQEYLGLRSLDVTYEVFLTPLPHQPM
jgi:hypothetical protein